MSDTERAVKKARFVLGALVEDMLRSTSLTPLQCWTLIAAFATDMISGVCDDHEDDDAFVERLNELYKMAYDSTACLLCEGLKPKDHQDEET